MTKPTLCPDFCADVIRSFAAHNPHANLRELIRQRANGCCTWRQAQHDTGQPIPRERRP